MRRSLAILCAVTVGATALAVSAPATAAPAPAANEAAHEAVPDELLVGYVRGASDSDKDRARGRAAAQRQERVVAAAADRTEVELVRLPRGKDRDQAIAQLQSDPAVAYAEPNWVYQHAATTDPYFTDGRLWGMKSATATADIKSGGQSNAFGSGAAAAWAAGHTGSKAVYVGVIDEGSQFDHPDLAGQFWINPYDPVNGRDDDDNGFVDDVRGWDFDANDNSIYDGGTRGSLDDHGTHVAGTIGAKANSVGVVGVNHNVTLISGKFLGRRGGTAANSTRAVNYFTDLKIRHKLNIVATNNSWGGGGFSQALLDAINLGGDNGILFIAAAGNGGTDQVGDNNNTSASYPSNYECTSNGKVWDCVIAVAAITSTGAISSFSNFGSRTVDIGAPGSDIWSTTAYNGYSSYNGTSMATPHVTGGAALLAASGASSETIKRVMLGNALPTPSLAGKVSTGGRLDVSRF